MYFFAFNLEKFTPDRICYTGSARGARDKYEVWVVVMVVMVVRKRQIQWSNDDRAVHQFSGSVALASLHLFCICSIVNLYLLTLTFYLIFVKKAQF